MTNFPSGRPVRVTNCPNRAGQIGIAGAMCGNFQAVNFVSVDISPAEVMKRLGQMHFVSAGYYGPEQLEAV
ncbi:hypothetical protein [Silvimonas soli]|uniref:hypothetical protein n=1 Tax=Silvimonas soli TaxID=2980100 RepID=UPI0024B36B99|nr:hypothetical protein [Silvimonas soli]